MQLFNFYCRIKIYYFSKIKHEDLQFIKIKYDNGKREREKNGIKEVRMKSRYSFKKINKVVR